VDDAVLQREQQAIEQQTHRADHDYATKT